MMNRANKEMVKFMELVIDECEKKKDVIWNEFIPKHYGSLEHFKDDHIEDIRIGFRELTTSAKVNLNY